MNDMNTRRAGCAETRTSGSEVRTGETDHSQDGTALRSDPYYQSLKVAPHGDEIAFFIEGDWVLARDGDIPDPSERFSDVTFAPTNGQQLEGGTDGR